MGVAYLLKIGLKEKKQRGLFYPKLELLMFLKKQKPNSKQMRTKSLITRL